MNLESLIIDSITDKVFNDVHSDVMSGIAENEIQTIENNILTIIESTVKHIIRYSTGEE